MARREPTSSSEYAMACNFEIIDDDQDKPLAGHLYLFEVIGASMLNKLIVGSSCDEATSALHAESAILRRACEQASGLQTRCLVVWLHGAHLKDAIETKLDRDLVPRLLVAGCGSQQACG